MRSRWGEARKRIINVDTVMAWCYPDRGFWMLYQLEHNGIATYVGATSSPRVRVRIHKMRDLLRDGGKMRVLAVGGTTYIHDLERARIAQGLQRGEPLENRYGK